MIDHLLVCSCGEVLIKSAGAEVKMRQKILIFDVDKGCAFAVCKGCGSRLEVPVKLDRSDLLFKSRNPRLFVKDVGHK